MAFYTPAGTKVLNLPEQVQKNLEDIADLKTAVDTKQDASTAVTKESLTTDISGKDVDLGATSVTSLTNTGNTTNNGTLDQEGTATFGSDVEVDGNVTLNSPESILFKTGSLDFSEITSFLTTYYANVGIYAFGGFEFTSQVNNTRTIMPVSAKATNLSYALHNASYDSNVTTITIESDVAVTSADDMIGGLHPTSDTQTNAIKIVVNAPNGIEGASLFRSWENLKPNITEITTTLDSQPILAARNDFNCVAMFSNLTKLVTIGAFDFSACNKYNDFENSFGGCLSLKTIHATHFKSSFDIHYSTQFEEADLVEIIGNLDTVSTAQTLTMGSTNLAKLTEDEILVATGKGWTLA